MNARTRQLLDELLVLPAEDRALIAAELEASLDEEPASPEEIEKEWAAEIEQRSRDVEEGRAIPIAAEDVHRELRAGLGVAPRATSRRGRSRNRARRRCGRGNAAARPSR